MQESQPVKSDDGLINPNHYLGSIKENMTYGAVLALSLARSSPLMGGPETRDVLPEPVDIINHIGNLSISFVLANHLSHSYWGKRQSLATPESYKRQRKIIAATIGGVAIAANAYAEKYGYGPISTPDPLDFVYGCIGGYLAYKVGLPRYAQPEVLDFIEQDYPEDSPLRQRINNLREEKAELAILKSKGSKPAKNIASNGPAQTRNKNRGDKKKSSRKQQRQSRQRNR